MLRAKSPLPPSLERQCAEVATFPHRKYAFTQIANGNWFILITEKLDESLVLMKMAYDLQYDDVVFTSMKVRNHPHQAQSQRVHSTDGSSNTDRRRVNDDKEQLLSPHQLQQPETQGTGNQHEQTVSRSRQLRKSKKSPGRDTSVITSSEADLLRDIQPCDSALYTLAQEVHRRRVQAMGGQAAMDAEVKKLRAARERILTECQTCAGNDRRCITCCNLHSGSGPCDFCCSLHLDNMVWIRKNKEACGYKFFARTVRKSDILYPGQPT